jgi:hypothetical protein
MAPKKDTGRYTRVMIERARERENLLAACKALVIARHGRARLAYHSDEDLLRLWGEEVKRSLSGEAPAENWDDYEPNTYTGE